jgi:hypothetical protein
MHDFSTHDFYFRFDYSIPGKEISHWCLDGLKKQRLISCGDNMVSHFRGKKQNINLTVSSRYGNMRWRLGTMLQPATQRFLGSGLRYREWLRWISPLAGISNPDLLLANGFASSSPLTSPLRVTTIFIVSSLLSIFNTHLLSFYQYIVITSNPNPF